MNRRICLLAVMCLGLSLLGSVVPAQASCRPCDCVVCAVAPDSCCYAVGQGNISCSDFLAQSCSISLSASLASSAGACDPIAQPQTLEFFQLPEAQAAPSEK